jgi:hypothetical protein
LSPVPPVTLPLTALAGPSVSVHGANAYDEGLSDLARNLIPHPSEDLFTLPTTRSRYEGGVSDFSLIAPDGWTFGPTLVRPTRPQAGATDSFCTCPPCASRDDIENPSWMHPHRMRSKWFIRDTTTDGGLRSVMHPSPGPPRKIPPPRCVALGLGRRPRAKSTVEESADG